MNPVKKKAHISEILRDWYFIDSVLLNGHAKTIITDSKDYHLYLSLKKALLTDLSEFYNHIGYDSKFGNGISNTKALQKSMLAFNETYSKTILKDIGVII